MLRIAIVGFGGYGWNLVKRMDDPRWRDRCELVAAADIRLDKFADRAKELSDRGVEVYGDAIEMFERLRGRCEAVHIATSIHSHAPLMIEAAARGFHVYLEKPPAATVQEVDRMIEAQQAAGVVCLVGFQQIHGADAQFLKQRIASGRLGRIRTMACRAGWPRGAAYYARNEWAGLLRSGEGWVLDGPATNALAHQLNNLLFLAGQGARDYASPARVRAELYAAGPVESHNTAAIEMETPGGVRALFLGSHCTQETFGPIVEIRAERAEVLWHPFKRVEITYADGATEAAENDEAVANMIANFLDAAEHNDPSEVRCSLADARNMALALNGAHESSGSIHRIDVPAVHTVDPGTDNERTVVEGLDDLVTRAAEHCCLFSDLADAPAWSVPTKPYDLTSYTSFPQQFRCE